MSVKIKISYNTDDELAGVLELLSAAVKSLKVPEKQNGRYKRAYVNLKASELK